MSWCDKLASTPTVGIRYMPHHQSGDSIIDALTPLFDAWVDGRKQKFTIEKQEPFAVQFVTEDGFQYTVNQEAVIVEFRHRWRVKPQSGGPPAAELISVPRPFTELLPLVASRAAEAVALIIGARSISLDRIGIVSSTVVSEKESPPGVLRFIDFVSKPWNTALDNYQIQITASISSSDDQVDRCIHAVSKAEDENPDNLLSIKLDWQRRFLNRKIVTTDVLKKYLLSAQNGALAYFEDVAEGGRFDEQLIGIST